MPVRPLLFLLVLAGAAQAQPERPPALPDADGWAETVLDTLSLEGKVAQLFLTDARTETAGVTFAETERLRQRVDSLGVGGVLFFRGEARRQARLTRRLQAQAAIPLLVAQDMEHGVGMRLSGATALPRMMALGAAADTALAYRAGRHVAAEARALGVHANFAPVADVNNNPANPIINVRSFGEDPEAVADLTAAYVRGIQDGGLLAFAKHFPGHGDTDLDSHHGLPLLPFGRDRLEAVELVPFRRAVDAGVRGMMTGHLAVPALEPDSTLPATLSPRVVDFLRDPADGLGFGGLVVTDGLDMGGITEGFGVEEAVVRAVAAGVDLVILAKDEPLAVRALAEAVRSGRVSEERVDEAALRVLRAKEWLGLDRPQAGSPGAARRALPPVEVAELSPGLRRRGRALADSVARRSLTLLRNDRGLLPLLAGRCLLVLSLTDERRPDAVRPFVDALKAAVPDSGRVAHRALTPDADPFAIEAAFHTAEAYDVVVVPTLLRVGAWKGRIGLPEVQRRLIDRLVALGKPVVLVALGNPYVPMGLEEQPAAVVAAYDTAPAVQRAAAVALTGQLPFAGRLPVTIPAGDTSGTVLFRRGDGIRLPQQALRRADPAALDPDSLLAMDDAIREAIAERAFPGAVLAVGVGGDVLKLTAYGRHTYASDSPRVTERSRFDLASLTKPLATTLAAMRLWEQGRLDLDAPVEHYLPAFRGPGKAAVTVRHLLTHSAGLRAFHPFHTEGFSSADSVLAFVLGDSLQAAPGTEHRYSDFGFVLLGEIVEAVTGEELGDHLHRTVYEPLGMRDTGFRAPGTFDPLALPTEHGTMFRDRLLQGEVHDETASLLGGVAGHAGLFSTALDLARLGHLLASGGAAYGHRLLEAETIRHFTRRAAPEGAYPATLGWVAWRPPSEGYSSGGTRMGPGAFGHTGFTGTSFWVQPETGLWVILLTNRVYPERGGSIAALRGRLADLAVGALDAGRTGGEAAVDAGTAGAAVGLSRPPVDAPDAPDHP